MTVFALIGGAISGFVVTLIGGTQLLFSYLIGLLGWFLISIISMKWAIGRYLGEPQSWRRSIACWWSLMWRMSFYALLVGFILSILVSAIIGRPSEHPGYVFLGWFILFCPVEIFAFRQVAVANLLSATQHSK
jgi:hypothetical protein